MTAIEELEGEFVREILHRPIGVDDDSPQRWVLIELRNGRAISGNAKRGELQPGSNYRFIGKSGIYKEKPSFSFTSFAPASPTSLNGIMRYLQKAEGIGPQLAAKIVGEFGTDSLNACRDRQVEVETKCGIPQTVASRLSNQLKAGQAIEKTMIGLEELLSGRGFRRTLPKEAFTVWGANAEKMIRENPYVLWDEFKYCGFKLCDSLYQHLGLPLDSIVRQKNCVRYAVKSDVSGSTWIPKSQIIKLMHECIQGARLRISEAICEALNDGLIYERNGLFADAERADSESSLVSDIFAAVNETIRGDGF